MVKRVLLKFWKTLDKLPSPSFGIAFALTTLTLACRAASQLVVPATPVVFSPLETHTPTTTSSIPAILKTETPTPYPSPNPSATSNQSTESPGCEGLLALRLLDSPEQAKDLFEHHAQGIFLILHLEATNLTQNPIQIFSDDYTLIIPQENDVILVKPHKAATNYLYLVRGDSFYQDKIKPASIWRTYLAFDIPPETTEWRLQITPGVGNSPPICQTIIYP